MAMNKSERIYISGKMNGLSRAEWLRNFADAELKLVRDYNYHPDMVVNPARLACLFKGLSDRCYMSIDLWLLSECDAIYMQSNWTDSKGAQVEYRLAKAKGLRIIYESDEVE